MRVLVSGSLAYDRIMDFPGRFRDHILPDKIHSLSVSFTVRTFRQGFGGTAGNIAYNLALLGVTPFIASAYGSDFGEYKRWCRKNGMRLDCSTGCLDIPTTSAYVITDQDDNQITGFFPGAMVRQCRKISRAALHGMSMAIVSPGNNRDMRVLPRELKKASVPYIYDPGQQLTSLRAADIIQGIQGSRALVSNDYELSLIQKKTHWNMQQLLKATEVVITTYGKKGSVITTATRACRIQAARPKNTSDPTGAGDAYRAGLIAGFLRGYPLPVIGRLASVVSVYTVEKYGTQTHSFTWKDVCRRYYVNFRERLE
ncbi:MAG: carbohydrate kinase family protein [Patescibacteria group bacterium]|nr:carbohydrate kinase family protein [Patescibacteria group bacterium]MDD5715185.1 carbohydrate kinase family protein [Patescibacteria group bacterium]